MMLFLSCVIHNVYPSTSQQSNCSCNRSTYFSGSSDSLSVSVGGMDSCVYCAPLTSGLLLEKLHCINHSDQPPNKMMSATEAMSLSQQCIAIAMCWSNTAFQCFWRRKDACNNYKCKIHIHIQALYVYMNFALIRASADLSNLSNARLPRDSVHCTIG